ncbi:MAG TPA: isochorismate synthase [Planctomycetota bacterium]|nr:isochorismate synthase [Planctomycetota bacterium]
MSEQPISAETRARARQACADALALARLGPGGTAWAVVGWACDLPRQPIALFTAEVGRRRLGWSAASDQWLLGVGEAWEHAASGPGRIAAVATAAARMTARCVVAAPDDAPAGPCLMHALAFEERAPAASHWGPSLPGMRTVLPRRLAWRRGDGSGWRFAATAVAAGEQVDDAVARLFAPIAKPDVAPTAPWPTPATDYTTLVEDATSLIRDGALRKVVLARAVDVALPTGYRHDLALARLREACDPASTLYACDLDDGTVFVGATPELLFAVDGARLTTMALAGSSRRSADPAEDRRLAAALHASTKERKEHGVVVEHLAAVLRPRCAPFTVPSTPRIRELPRLFHLETALEAELTTGDHLELLGALHPTPAVCGLPTPMALSWLARHERLHRGLYAGALGWSTPAACRFAVALRGGIVDLAGRRARLFAGAGIVETSDAQAELAETELKLRVMRIALGMDTGGEAGG